ncbi:MAG: hypothetical protein ACLQU2_03215 [Candidatus Binataceae bacterium]
MVPRHHDPAPAGRYGGLRHVQPDKHVDAGPYGVAWRVREPYPDRLLPYTVSEPYSGAYGLRNGHFRPDPDPDLDRHSNPAPEHHSVGNLK